MDYLLALTCKDGRPMTKLMRDSSQIRGRLSVNQQWDEERRRHLLVAMFTPVGGQRKVAEPVHLFDVLMLPTLGDSLVLTGSERVVDSPAVPPRWVSQTWVIRPAHDEDLAAVELKWAAASAEVERLRKLLGAMGVATSIVDPPALDGEAVRAAASRANRSKGRKWT